MLDYDQEPGGAGFQDSIGVERAEFTTAFRSGTGGHRVVVLGDRIVTYYRTGGASQLPIEAVVSISAFESGFSQPSFGVHFETRLPSGAIGYRFETAEIRSAFVRAVQQQLARAGNPRVNHDTVVRRADPGWLPAHARR